jgi:hypothetical protein
MAPNNIDAIAIEKKDAIVLVRVVIFRRPPRPIAQDQRTCCGRPGVDAWASSLPRERISEGFRQR